MATDLSPVIFSEMEHDMRPASINNCRDALTDCLGARGTFARTSATAPAPASALAPAPAPATAPALALALALAIALALAPGTAQTAEAALVTQDIACLPDVTEEMTHASYWSDKQEDPDAVLADRATIDKLNQDGIDADDTYLQPLKEAREYFYSAEQQATLKNSAESELNGFVNDKAEDLEGNALTEEDAQAILANYPADGAAPDIASQYAIVTTHTTMRCFPTDRMLGLTPGDQDDDNLYLAALRVNEPLIVRAQSVDKKYLLCISSCLTPSWVPAEDVAICADKAEWLDAWDIAAGQELVVVDYKVRTEQTRVTPNTANRLLYMGTVLQRVDLTSSEQALELVGTRSAYYNHVCYLPVRNADGTYSKELALIAQSAKVSEGYLPLTKANTAEVAFRALGQMYGWGGMLEANDCSGYVRDVYKCFGLELARNTTWQMNLPVRTYDLAGMSSARKAAAIAQMPLGTVLFWGGHEMIYLGQEGGKLYVISSLGSIGDIYGDEYASHQIKSVAVNTLDMIRGSRATWLDTLTCANIPYIPASEQGAGLYDMAFYENGITWPDASYPYTGAAIAPSVEVPGLVAGADYEVSFANNVNVGTATVTVKGIGDYSGEVSRSFSIVSNSLAKAKVTVANATYTGKAITPKPTVKLGSATLAKDADYTVSYLNNTAVGTAVVVVKGKDGFVDSNFATFTIGKASQSIAAKGATKTLKATAKTGKLSKNATLDLKKLAKVSAKTAVKYRKANKAGGAKISVNASSGKMTVKKGLKKGTYNVKVKLTAAANASYKAASAKTVTVKVIVK